MVGKKNILVQVLALFLVALVFTGCTQSSGVLSGDSNTESSKGDQPVRIGVSQIVEHPALDAAFKGFVDGLESKGFTDGKEVEIDFQNAQGDIPTTQTIAKNFVSDKKDMILAIATPTAQAAYNATKDIPILITAVTDPLDAGLVESWEKPGTNVTGTSDATPIEKQFDLLTKLIPDVKKVGIIYNTSESNSEIQVKNAKEIAANFNFEIETIGVTTVNEIPQALNSLLDKVDVLYVPTDNLVVSAMPIVSAESLKRNIPVIGSERGQVESGALATEGIDYYKLGFQTGLVATEIINGKVPSEIPVSTLEDTDLIINVDTAKKLGIEIPKDLRESAELIGEGE